MYRVPSSGGSDLSNGREASAAARQACREFHLIDQLCSSCPAIVAVPRCRQRRLLTQPAASVAFGVDHRERSPSRSRVISGARGVVALRGQRALHQILVARQAYPEIKRPR